MHLVLMEGLLPSFAACKKLEQLYVNQNQFSGSYFGSIFVYPVLLAVSFYFINSDLISIVPFVPTIRTGALPSFAACTALEKFWCHSNKFTGKINHHTTPHCALFS